MTYGLLDGMRVVEGSAFVAVPLGGMTLAQLGADVIRFDALEGGLDSDRWPLTREGRSLYWNGLNKGKRSIAIDLRSPRGQELIAALITAPGEDAGIFLTNLPARGALAYEALTKTRPDLIALTLTGTRDGAPQVDYTVNAAVGFPMITGPEGHEGPVNQVLPAWDIATGLMASTAILAADRHRRKTGKGQRIGLALLDVALAMAGNLGYLAEAQVNKVDRPRVGNHIFGTFGSDFPTADGRYVMVCIFTKRQLHALAEATGAGEAFAELERRTGLDLEDEAARYEAREEIAAIVKRWVGARTLADVGAAFDKAGVLWGPYQTFRQLMETDPRASAAHPMFSTVEQPGVGPYLVPGMPLDFGAVRRLPPKPAPLLGQDTDAILAEVLGLPDGAIAKLHDDKVVAGPKG